MGKIIGDPNNSKARHLNILFIYQ